MPGDDTASGEVPVKHDAAIAPASSLGVSKKRKLDNALTKPQGTPCTNDALGDPDEKIDEDSISQSNEVMKLRLELTQSTSKIAKLNSTISEQRIIVARKDDELCALNKLLACDTSDLGYLKNKLSTQYMTIQLSDDEVRRLKKEVETLASKCDSKAIDVATTWFKMIGDCLDRARGIHCPPRLEGQSCTAFVASIKEAIEANERALAKADEDFIEWFKGNKTRGEAFMRQVDELCLGMYHRMEKIAAMKLIRDGRIKDSQLENLRDEVAKKGSELAILRGKVAETDAGHRQEVKGLHCQIDWLENELWMLKQDLDIKPATGLGAEQSRRVS